MALMFENRYGFFDSDNNKFVGYIYKDTNTNRYFSVANIINTKTFYVNELDESFGPNDNTYSVLVAASLDESKDIIKNLLKGKK